MSEKIRLDQLIFDRNLTESKERAKALVMAGVVYVKGQKETKPGTKLLPDSEIEVRDNTNKFVSRGGFKLEKAINKFGIELSGKIAMDIGASTGGFTDCMLQNGAAKVYAVDVGYGQLAWKLRTDCRVVNLERTNIRYVTNEQVPESIDFASIDVAFISLKLVLPVAYSLLNQDGYVVALVKPQFEAGREKVGKKGVVRDINVHLEVLENCYNYAENCGFQVIDTNYSPIKGPDGNIEFLLYIKKSDEKSVLSKEDLSNIVKEAHECLNGG